MFTERVLLKFIRLLYMEAKLHNASGNSMDNVRELLEENLKSLSEEDNAVNGLVEVLNEMYTHDFEDEMSPQHYRIGLVIALGEEQSPLINILLDVEDVKSLTLEIAQARAYLRKITKTTRLKSKFMQANFKIQKNEIPDEELTEFLEVFKDDIDKNNPTITGDKAVTGKISTKDRSTLVELFKKIKAEASDLGVWRTHLTGFNRMTQGGLRDGHLNFVNGLQHSYKSGLVLNLFAGLPRLNPPKESDRPGKPTLVWLSMEDSLVKVMADIYGFFKVWENPNIDRIELEDIDPEDATTFVMDIFDATGYDVEFYKIDSSDFSFRSLFDFLTKLESEGASLRVVGIDYIATIPKTGCSKTGATGADTRELVRRIRNWMQARDIVCLSPHQLSQGAKNLIKEGLDPKQLVERVLGKGYTADSGQIDQELDLEVAISRFKHNDMWYLHVGCGKHKLNSVIANDDDKFFITQFPTTGNKIPPDIHLEETTMGVETSRCFPNVDSLPRDDVYGLGYKPSNDTTDTTGGYSNPF